MKKILFITQKRNDSIGLVDIEILSILKNENNNIFTFFEILPKSKNKYLDIYYFFINLNLLLFKCIFYKKIYFTWENSYPFFIKKIFGKKVIIYVLVHHIEDYFLKDGIGKKSLLLVDEFFTVSNFTKDQLLEIGIINNINENYNGINQKLFYNDKEKIYNGKYILYVGAESERKNLKFLFEGFKLILNKYPDIKLIKIGRTYKKEDILLTDSLLKTLNLYKNVILIRDFISNDELRKYYSNALFFISASKLEGFGLPVIEAMSCGCPVLLSNIPPFIEIIGNSSDNIFKIDDIHDMYFKIHNLLEDINLRNKIISYQYEQLNKFTRENNVKLLKDILTK